MDINDVAEKVIAQAVMRIERGDDAQAIRNDILAQGFSPEAAEQLHAEAQRCHGKRLKERALICLGGGLLLGLLMTGLLLLGDGPTATGRGIGPVLLGGGLLAAAGLLFRAARLWLKARPG